MIKEVELSEMADDGMDTGSPGHDILDQVEKDGKEGCAHGRDAKGGRRPRE